MFTGAAHYINVVEQPARLRLGHNAALPATVGKKGGPISYQFVPDHRPGLWNQFPHPALTDILAIPHPPSPHRQDTRPQPLVWVLAFSGALSESPGLRT